MNCPPPRRRAALGLALAGVLLLAACATDAAPPVATATPVAPAIVMLPTGTPAPTATTAATGVLPTDTALPPAPPSSDPARFNVVVQIDPASHHPISPLIYGVGDSGPADEDWLRWLGATLIRWGGNARTRHNWEINASNAGSDWEFRNVSQGDDVPGSASLQFLQRNTRLGAASIMSIPTIGWVARDKNNDTRSLNVPDHGGPSVTPNSAIAFIDYYLGQWIHPYDPAANRARTSLPSFPRKGAPFSYPPDLKDGKVYQDEWVAYMRSVRPAGAPPPLYSMDNEPELWSDDTHVDVHPARLGYDAELNTFLTYARAVKDADPAALVTGPESWGVTAYLYSALDESGDQFRTAADRAAHGGLPWLAWFLDAAHKSDLAAGRRSLDVLSVHYYPNADENSTSKKTETQDRRVQAPRALWDGSYVEPSWVARTEWANLDLLPRLHELINRYYPGTKVGISEWNYGGEDDISGALATADVLGIYGREDVYFATYWKTPPMNSPSGWAFRLYRNYDGKGAAFGGESVTSTSGDPETVSAYGALAAGGAKLTVMLINKDPSRTADVVLRPGSFQPRPAATVYRYGGGDLKAIAALPLAVSDPAAVHVAVPPYSISLVVLDR